MPRRGRARAGDGGDRPAVQPHRPDGAEHAGAVAGAFADPAAVLRRGRAGAAGSADRARDGRRRAAQRHPRRGRGVAARARRSGAAGAGAAQRDRGGAAGIGGGNARHRAREPASARTQRSPSAIRRCPPEEGPFAAADEYDNLGIGRSVAETIVEAHGGALRAERSGPEATAYIRLPVSMEASP